LAGGAEARDRGGDDRAGRIGVGGGTAVEIALGRKSWLFAGSDRGGQRAAAMYSLIVTAKMNDIDPQTWLADVLARIAGIRPKSSTNCCRGTGAQLFRLSARQPDHGRDTAEACGAHRMLTGEQRFGSRLRCASASIVLRPSRRVSPPGDPDAERHANSVGTNLWTKGVS
jgi:hypothetical protein